MVIAIVLFWALLGVGVFFIAMRGGPKGARQALRTDSPAGRRLVALGIVVLFAAGLAVPALVLAFNGEDKASVAAGGLHLNPAQERGRELFARACAVCHTPHAAQAVGRPGPNLDARLGEQISTPSARAALGGNGVGPGRARGPGPMAAPPHRG